MKNKKYPSSVKNRRLTKPKILVIIILLALMALGISEATNTTHFLHKQTALLTKDSGSSGQSSGGKSSSKSSSSPSTSSGSGGPSSTTGQGVNQSAASDTHGQCASSIPSSHWAVSTSGLITLKSPAANSTFKPIATICGTAKVSKVWYRLVDDSAGVISQGAPLNVVGGKFSGTLNFHAYAQTGHLDVYSFNSSGAEVNEVSVPLHF